MRIIYSEVRGQHWVQVVDTEGALLVGVDHWDRNPTDDNIKITLGRNWDLYTRTNRAKPRGPGYVITVTQASNEFGRIIP